MNKATHNSVISMNLTLMFSLHDFGWLDFNRRLRQSSLRDVAKDKMFYIRFSLKTIFLVSGYLFKWTAGFCSHCLSSVQAVWCDLVETPQPRFICIGLRVEV